MIIQPTALLFQTASLKTDDLSVQIPAMNRFLSAQISAQTAYTLRVASQLQKRLVAAQMESAIFNTERAMWNNNVELRTQELAGRFSLMSKLVQVIS
ncbi:hypothetical protein [Brucella sp. IR073]|uniref:hypothetical protein n=1 Tax=unclassified Brucella TaxID=2632610 RepID=UPI003B97DF6A